LSFLDPGGLSLSDLSFTYRITIYRAMPLYCWVENGITPRKNRNTTTTLTFPITGRISIPRDFSSTPPFSIPPTIDPFPYLPPELIVHVVSESPASSIPALLETNHFFNLHVHVFKRQIIKSRLERYPALLLVEYALLTNVNIATLHVNPKAWHILDDIERKADCCIAVQDLLFPKTSLSPDAERRFFRTFLRQWQSRKNMFFTRQQWEEGIIDRTHIYENASRSEICDIVHLQTLYRNALAEKLVWSPQLLPPLNPLDADPRVYWPWKPPLFRNLVDHIIGCGPELLLSILRSSEPHTTTFLSQALVALECDGNGAKFCCFDDVMGKLLTKLDGATGPAATWREEESYFDVCVVGNWFAEGDVRSTPMVNSLYFRAALSSVFHDDRRARIDAQ
jgi:hypothetical protein